MLAKSPPTIAPNTGDVSHIVMVEALFSTLETLLPHAANLVEDKTRELAGQMTALVHAATAQESTIAKLVACVQHMQLEQREIPMEDYLKRVEASLTFALEHSIYTGLSAQGWHELLGTESQSLQALAEDAHKLAGQVGADNRDCLDKLRLSLKKSARHLADLGDQIRNAVISERDRKLYQSDVRLVGEMLRHQPGRAKLLHTLLQDIHHYSRVIAETGRAAITAIQFQDYNTQLNENALKIVGLLRQAVLPDQHMDPAEYQQLVQSYQTLTLEEVRRMLLEHLHGKPVKDVDPEHDCPAGVVEWF